MRLSATFVRSGEARTPTVFVPIRPARGRPQVSLRAHIFTEADVDEARWNNVPLFALKSKTVTALGYPIRFPTQLVVARSVLPAVETPYRVIPFVSEVSAARPRLEDVAIALLSLDPIASRVVLERNRRDVDADYLLKRVLTENVERLASFVRYFDLAPALPHLGNSIPQSSLEREFRKNWPVGRLP